MIFEVQYAIPPVNSTNALSMLDMRIWSLYKSIIQALIMKYECFTYLSTYTFAYD